MVYKRATNAREVLPKMRTPLHSSFSCLHQPCVRRRSFIAHTRKRLAFIVALACTSPALIVPHRRSRSQAPCAHPRSHARECLAFTSSLIVAQARHSSTLKLETPCVHRRSCSQSPCAHRPSCLQQPCAQRLSSSLTLAIALDVTWTLDLRTN